MTIDRLFVPDGVVIVRAATTTDRYGNTVSDWEDTTRTTVDGWVAQTGTDEGVGDRQHVTSTWAVFLPAGTDLEPGDRVEWQGDTFEVHGRPNRARRAGRTRGGVHHVEAELRTVEG